MDSFFKRLALAFKTIVGIWFLIILTMALSGCAAERDNPLAVENLNGDPPKQESVAMEIDARGVLNGKLVPSGDTPSDLSNQVITYAGNWIPVKSSNSPEWYTMTSVTPGATVEIVATLSRIVFDFWDFDFYENPGNVSFFIDGKPLGSFDMARSSDAGQKITDYQITTQKNTVATITMKLNSGRVAISGYLLLFLDKNYPY
jgi:hypothetical protein